MNQNKLRHISSAIPVNTPGILDQRELPDDEFSDLWDAIIIEGEVKSRLLSQAVLNFTLRPKVKQAELPLHGIILLVGEPGTGKTSLARGLASVTAKTLKRSEFLYLEVEPHGLSSSSLGKSQKAVTVFLGSTVAEQAAIRPVIVLLDEVETLAADRTKMGFEANPIDVHRATDAVLAQLDHLAGNFQQLLFIATSNFPEAIDQAFLSRADVVVTLDMPGPTARRKILTRTLEEMASVFPSAQSILSDCGIEKVIEMCDGLDGRRIRKLVATACTFNKETALNPGRLTIADILRAAESERQFVKSIKGRHK